MNLSTEITYVKGVGPHRATMFGSKGIVTVEDLLAYIPFRYEDRSNVKSIRQLAPGEMATVIAEVKSAGMVNLKRRNLGLFEAVFMDASHGMMMGKWFHAKYLENVLTPGQKVAL
ncbi:MAG: ATP-dependent DNA helicase RecG, partial [Bryobacteraceae bacterium]